MDGIFLNNNTRSWKTMEKCLWSSEWKWFPIWNSIPSQHISKTLDKTYFSWIWKVLKISISRTFSQESFAKCVPPKQANKTKKTRLGIQKLGSYKMKSSRICSPCRMVLETFQNKDNEQIYGAVSPDCIRSKGGTISGRHNWSHI